MWRKEQVGDFAHTVQNLEKALERARQFRLFGSFASFVLVETPSGEQKLVIIGSGSGDETELERKAELYWPYDQQMPESIVVIISRNKLLEVPTVVKSLLKDAKSVHEVGYDHGLIDLANDEFLRQVDIIQERYQDKNLPAMLKDLEKITEKDYDRWRKAKQPESRPKVGGFKDKRARAYVLLANEGNGLGGPQYRQIRENVTNQLHGPQGHPNEDFMIDVGLGKYQDFPPSEALARAAHHLEDTRMGIGREMVFFQTMTVNNLCATKDLRDVMLANMIKGNDWNIDQQIVQTEVIRLLLIRELKG